MVNWHKTKNIVKSKRATYRFREDMSWNSIGRFGRSLRMFGDMQTGLKKSFRCRKDQNSATNPCDPRAVISLIVTHYQAQFTEIIRFGSVCAHTCRGISIDCRRPAAGARFAIGRRPAFGVRHGSLRIARTFQDAESEETVFKSARKIPSYHLKDIPVTFISFRRREFERET